MKKLKLLYIGHPFHLKSHSADFFKKVIDEKFDVTYMLTQLDCFLPESAMQTIAGQKFDVLCCYQVMPSIKVLKKYITFERGVAIPMADYYYGLIPWNQPIWEEYQDFKVICFSKKMQNELSEHGFDTEYVQYFPKPGKFENPGDEHGVYFWQRVTHLNVYTVMDILKNFSISKLHIHKVLDPGEKFIPLPYNYRKFPVTYSNWYDTSAEMKEDMRNYAIYIAPRFLEGIGLAFLEAMADGRCVIANNDTTHNEYIEHGKTGFLFDIKKPMIDLSSYDIRTIQKNSYEYICDGYKKWCEELPKLADRFFNPVKNNPELLKKNEEVWKNASMTLPFLQNPTEFIENANYQPKVSKLRKLFRKIKEVRSRNKESYIVVKKVSVLRMPIFEKKISLDGRRILINVCSVPVFTAEIF